MPAVGFLIMRTLFAAAEQIAPRLTGRAAFALFCRTPNPNRLSAREARALATAEPFMAQARKHRLPIGNGHVTAYEFRGDTTRRRSPTVLVLHGWRSRSEHMRVLVDALCGAGFRVIALDFPGHGASSGRSLNMANAVISVRSAADWFGPFAAIVGHSFGGAVAVNAIAGSIRDVAPVEAGRLVLIAAPSSLPALFEDFGRFLRLGARTQMSLAEEVERIAGRPLAEFVGADQLRALPLPTLAVHAPDDREVPFSEARGYEAAGDHVTVLRVPGRGHRRILADPDVAKAVAAFALSQEIWQPQQAG